MMSRTDAGEATAQAVIVVPIVLLILWLAVQATIFLHGANVATAAANEGAAVAARYGSSSSVGERAIERTLTNLDSNAEGTWSVRLSGGEMIAKVTLRLPRLVPFFPSSVSRSAYERVEAFMKEGDR